MTQKYELSIPTIAKAVAFSGGKVAGRKRLKCLMLIAYCSRLLRDASYKWDADFFGPYSSNIAEGVRDADYKSLLSTYFKPNEKKPYEPVHYLFALSELGEYYFEKYFESNRKKIKEKKIPHLIAWNIAPISLTVRKSLELEDKITVKRPKEEIREINYVTSNIAFTKDLIARLRRYWSDIDIKTFKTETKHPLFKEGCSYRIEINPETIDKKFSYLYDEKAIEELENSKEWSSYEAAKNQLPLMKFYEEKGVVKEEMFREEIGKIVKEGWQLVKNEDIQRKISKLKLLAEKSREYEDGIILRLNDDKVGIKVSKSLTKSVPDWDRGYLLHLLHTLEPIERGVFLKKQSMIKHN